MWASRKLYPYITYVWYNSRHIDCLCTDKLILQESSGKLGFQGNESYRWYIHRHLKIQKTLLYHVETNYNNNPVTWSKLRHARWQTIATAFKKSKRLQPFKLDFLIFYLHVPVCCLPSGMADLNLSVTKIPKLARTVYKAYHSKWSFLSTKTCFS